MDQNKKPLSEETRGYRLNAEVAEKLAEIEKAPDDCYVYLQYQYKYHFFDLMDLKSKAEAIRSLQEYLEDPADLYAGFRKVEIIPADKVEDKKARIARISEANAEYTKNLGG